MTYALPARFSSRGMNRQRLGNDASDESFRYGREARGSSGFRRTPVTAPLPRRGTDAVRHVDGDLLTDEGVSGSGVHVAERAFEATALADRGGSCGRMSPFRALALQCLRAAGEDSQEAPAEQPTADRLHRLASRVSRVGIAGQPVDVGAVGRRSKRQCAALVIERRD